MSENFSSDDFQDDKIKSLEKNLQKNFQNLMKKMEHTQKEVSSSFRDQSSGNLA